MKGVFLRGGYLDRASANLSPFDTSRDGALLFYAALEFRFAIERFLFAYLTRVNGDIGKTQEKLYEAGKLKAAILRAEPEFVKKLEFTNLCVKAIGHHLTIPIPDLDELDRLYGRLGRYLHAIKRPGETLQSHKWWTDLENLLREIEGVLAPVASQPIAGFSLNDAGLALFKDFTAGKKTEEEVKACFVEGIIDAA